MSIEIRFIEEDDVRRVREILTVAFGGGEVTPAWDPVWDAVFEKDRIFAAWEADEMVGVGGSFSFSMSVPGGELPTAGLTIVGVLPTHTRKGILKKMMETQLNDARDRGEPLSILWASQEIIYQRFGYGPATSKINIEVDKGHGTFRNDPGKSGRIRLVDEKEALKVLPGIYDRVRAERPGMPARSAKWWEFHRLFDPKEDREGTSPHQRAVWENDGSAEAYAIYRTKEDWDWDTGISKGSVIVLEAMSVNPTAHRELWRFLFGIDLMTKVMGYFLPIDDPLQLLVNETRHLRIRVNDAMWLRVVDLAAALERRSYRSAGTVTFSVSDDTCPWNAGTWRLETSGTETEVTRSTDEPEVTMSAADLGGTYLGGFSFAQMARAGRVSELVPGAIARLDDLFRTDIQPWNPEIF